MASIITEDNIVVQKLSDDEPSDSQRLRDKVAKIRAERAAPEETQAADAATDDAQETPDFLQRAFDYAQREVPRQLGLTGRYIAEGAAAPITMLGDAANAGINLGSRAIKGTTGYDLGELIPPSRVLSEALTMGGVPKPEGTLEKILSVPAQVMTGTGGMVRGAQAVANRAPETAKLIADALRKAPGTQAAVGTAAAPVALGADAATTAITGSPTAGDVAGMMAGMLIPTPSKTALSSTLSAGRQVIKPMTEAGRNEMVGNLLRRQTVDPARAVGNLETAPVFVEGSPIMTAGASKDAGLAAMETPVSALEQGAFGATRTRQMRARAAAMDKLAKTEVKLNELRASRERKTGQTRVKVFETAQPVEAGGIVSSIDAALAQPANVRNTVQAALRDFKAQISGAIKNGKIDPEALWSIRKDIDLAMRGKLSGDKRDYGQAQGQLADLRIKINEAIELGAPGFKKYSDRYAALSTPIRQLEALQQIRSKTTTGQPDAGGFDNINATQLRKIIRNNTIKVDGKQIPLKETLSRSQMARLNRIMDDLERGRAATAPGIKAPGSDTFKNLTTANIIGRALGNNPVVDTVGRTVLRPLDWLYGVPEAKMNDLLVASMLDAKLAAILIRKASPENSKNFAERSRELFPELFASQQTGVGATVGTQMNDASPQN